MTEDLSIRVVSQDGNQFIEDIIEKVQKGYTLKKGTAILFAQPYTCYMEKEPKPEPKQKPKKTKKTKVTSKQDVTAPVDVEVDKGDKGDASK